MAEFIPPSSMHCKIHPVAESGGGRCGSGIALESRFKLRGKETHHDAAHFIADDPHFLLSNRSLGRIAPGAIGGAVE